MIRKAPLHKDTFLAQLKKYNPTLDLELVGRAFDVANSIHENEKRDSGEPYMVHPMATALTLAKMRLDSSTIAAALLHDTAETPRMTFKKLERDFGAEIMNLVRGVTLVSTVRNYNRETVQIKTAQRMFLAMAKDIRVILIKLADRLHNMQTLEHKSPERAAFKARQTLDIFVPIADRLQINELKEKLEDLAFKHLYPREYHWLTSYTNKALAIRKRTIETMQREISQELKDADIRVLFLQGRFKSKHRLWLKLQRYNMDLSEIYDLIALRVVVPDVQSCYRALEIINRMYIPLREVKDYIAEPKPNGYRSLHTSLKNTHDEVVEVQIRTPRMHHEAEYGIAAHWAYADQFYKEHNINDRLRNKELEWVRTLAHWREKAVDNDEYWETLKIDFLNDRIYVETPKHDIIDLPVGSTPIDFAYRVHTAIGHHAVGCEINGKAGRLSQSLESGDIVRIFVNDTATPQHAWLDFVRTNNARGQIRAWLRTQDPESNRRRGKDLVSQEIRLLTKLDLSTFLRNLSGREQRALLKITGFKSWEEFFEGIGNGHTTFEKAFRNARERLGGEVARTMEDKLRGVLNVTHVVERDIRPVITPVLQPHKLYPTVARCCKPQVPDQITGYVTRKGGIIIHRSGCPELREVDQLRLFSATWETVKRESDFVPIQLTLRNDPNMVIDVKEEVAACGASVSDLKVVKEDKTQKSLQFKLQVDDLSHFLRICRSLRLLPSVNDIQRI